MTDATMEYTLQYKPPRDHETFYSFAYDFIHFVGEMRSAIEASDD